eukprot:5000702-Heterocapsa_arctica.AAC.1
MNCFASTLGIRGNTGTKLEHQDQDRGLFVSGAVASPRALQVAAAQPPGRALSHTRRCGLADDLRRTSAGRARLSRADGRREGTGQLERLAPSRPLVE